MPFKFHQTNKSIDMNKAMHDSILLHNGQCKKPMTSNTLISPQTDVKKTNCSGHKMRQSCITQNMDDL
jgi:hypothetical protein